MEKYTNTYVPLALSILSLIPNFKESKKPPFKIEDKLVNQLSNLTLSDQHFIAQKAADFIKICIDEPKLVQIIDEVYRHNADREIEDQYILLRASNTMMNELFGMHSTEFCSRRKALGISREGQHRPQNCNEATESRIIEEWFKNKHLDDKYRYLAVSDITGERLNVVWPVIKRYRTKTIK